MRWPNGPKFCENVFYYTYLEESTREVDGKHIKGNKRKMAFTMKRTHFIIYIAATGQHMVFVPFYMFSILLSCNLFQICIIKYLKKQKDVRSKYVPCDNTSSFMKYLSRSTRHSRLHQVIYYNLVESVLLLNVNVWNVKKENVKNQNFYCYVREDAICFYILKTNEDVENKGEIWRRVRERSMFLESVGESMFANTLPSKLEEFHNDITLLKQHRRTSSAIMLVWEI
uniref:Uncharacterized protein n=1 Tax=Timema genevievae TaxID=629358 RepID=A0A7R9JX49_TIMGE|nr:unnamed protein product [Timema genevievae]